MKKLLMGMVVFCLVLSGCAKKEVSDPSKDQPLKDEITQKDVEKIVEDDEDFEDIKKEYDVDQFVYVDENNKDDIIEQITTYVKEHKTEVIVLAATGVIVANGIGFVFANPLISAAVIGTIYALMNPEKVDELVEVINENGTVQSIKDYVDSHSLEDAFNDGVNFMNDKIQQFKDSLSSKNIGAYLNW